MSIIKTLKMSKPEKFNYVTPYETTKDRRAFINAVKKIVRGSKEYKDYISFLREFLDMDQCAFFGKIGAGTQRVKIEVHHEPFTLEDYTTIVIRKQLDEGIELDDLEVAKEVMRLHYQNMVGLIPLSKTIHQVVHSDAHKVIVPTYMVYGNFYKFFDEYYDYIVKDESLMQRFETKLQLTEELTESSFDVLHPKFEYIEVEGVQLPTYKIEDEADKPLEVELDTKVLDKIEGFAKESKSEKKVA